MWNPSNNCIDIVRIDMHSGVSTEIMLQGQDNKFKDAEQRRNSFIIQKNPWCYGH